MDGVASQLPDYSRNGKMTAWVARGRFPSFAEALRQVHRPLEPTSCRPESLAWTRLAFDELLAGQLALALVRSICAARPGRGSSSEGTLRA